MTTLAQPVAQTVTQKYITYSVTLRNLKTMRYAMNRRLLVLAEKLRATSAPEKIERYRQGAAKLSALQNLIAEGIQKERSIMRLTLSEQQSGIIVHALKLAHEEKNVALDAAASMDLRDVEQLESLAETEKMFMDALSPRILLQAGYDEAALQGQMRTLF
jgi:hypothetical protein